MGDALVRSLKEVAAPRLTATEKRVDCVSLDRTARKPPHRSPTRKPPHPGGGGKEKTRSPIQYGIVPRHLEGLPAFGCGGYNFETLGAPTINSAGDGVLAPPFTIHRVGLRYTVLEPLVPHLKYSISLQLACELLEIYFETRQQAPAHPVSPYILGFIFRRQSFLHATPPRPCRLALLSSILLVAAETSEASYCLQTSGVNRRWVCSLLKGLTLMNIQTDAGLCSLDDVVACIHMGVVQRDDEDGRFWFSTACFLAQAIGLGHELSSGATPTCQSMYGSEHVPDAEDEMREERRRAWWLLYMIDRVLALYENRPPILLECDVLQPMDEAAYQNGSFQACAGRRIGGPAFECNGRGVYAHLLPLMTILGESMAQRHDPSLDYPIRHHLEVYKRSLQRMSDEAQGSNKPVMEGDTEVQLIIAYGTLMARVLDILLNEQKEAWVGSTVEIAAVFEEIGHILHLDPDLKFIQFFFGIFLFRGLWPLVRFPNELQRNTTRTLNKLGEIVTAFDIHYRVRVAPSTLMAKHAANNFVSGVI